MLATVVSVLDLVDVHTLGFGDLNLESHLANCIQKMNVNQYNVNISDEIQFPNFLGFDIIISSETTK